MLNRLWEIGTAVQEQRVMKITYEKLKNHEVMQRIIELVGIVFSEYYFYLTAFIWDIDKEQAFENANDLYPTIYRIDRLPTAVAKENPEGGWDVTAEVFGKGIEMWMKSTRGYI